MIIREFSAWASGLIRTETTAASATAPTASRAAQLRSILRARAAAAQSVRQEAIPSPTLSASPAAAPASTLIGPPPRVNDPGAGFLGGRDFLTHDASGTPTGRVTGSPVGDPGASGGGALAGPPTYSGPFTNILPRATEPAEQAPPGAGFLGGPTPVPAADNLDKDMPGTPGRIYGVPNGRVTGSPVGDAGASGGGALAGPPTYSGPFTNTPPSSGGVISVRS